VFRLAAVAVLVFTTLCAAAQGPSALKQGSNEWGIFAGGGSGAGKRTNTQFLYFGGRYGRVLTPDAGPGPLRGNFELKFEVLPFEAVFQPPQNAYGVEFRPLLMTWNFIGNSKLKPYAQVGAGILFTNHDVPVNTNSVNFTPQAGLGLHVFTKPDRAVTFEVKYEHVSNAGLASKNAGVNATVQFTLGYTWFK
jgi:lipid A 3-O-deacylase